MQTRFASHITLGKGYISKLIKYENEELRDSSGIQHLHCSSINNGHSSSTWYNIWFTENSQKSLLSSTWYHGRDQNKTKNYYRKTKTNLKIMQKYTEPLFHVCVAAFSISVHTMVTDTLLSSSIFRQLNFSLNLQFCQLSQSCFGLKSFLQ